MSTATQAGFVKDAWQTPRNARTLRAFMALRNEEIAGRIRELRAAKGNPPQTLVAAEIGVGERTYQTWESGEAKPSYRGLQRLAEYYGVGEDYILTGAREDNEPAPAPPAVDGDPLAEINAKLDRILMFLGLNGAAEEEPTLEDRLVQLVKETAAAQPRRSARQAPS